MSKIKRMSKSDRQTVKALDGLPRVRIHMADGKRQVVGNVESFDVCNDAAWIHLTDCEPGPKLQAFSLDHVRFIRPDEPLQVSARFVNGSDVK